MTNRLEEMTEKFMIITKFKEAGNVFYKANKYYKAIQQYEYGASLLRYLDLDYLVLNKQHY